MTSADDSSFKGYGGFIILFCKLYIMYNVHLLPLFVALFVRHFSLCLWLLVDESPKCHQVPEAFNFYVSVEVIFVFVVNIICVLKARKASRQI